MEQEIYKSDAYERYAKAIRKYRKYPWLLVEDWTGTKVKWYRKPIMLIEYKISDIKDYFTNPKRILYRKINNTKFK